MRAAVEDADEPVGEGSEGLVVGGAAGALPVIERPGGNCSAPRTPAGTMHQPRWRLRAKRASTTRLVPEALVIGDMPE
jgi:hypothetical protein